MYCLFFFYYVKLYLFFFFFFFQAEDGIRDGRVTGVQTCALPICEIEVLVAGAGDTYFGKLADISTDEFESQLQIHLVGANRLAAAVLPGIDRKSTRLNSSHPSISYAVFCLKKKTKNTKTVSSIKR